MPLASSLRGIASFPRYLVSRRARRDTDSQFTIDVKVSVPARARGRVLLDERVFDQPISPSDEQLLIVRRVERDAPIVTVLDESDEDASRQAELARLRPRIEVASRTEEDDLLDHQQRLSDGPPVQYSVRSSAKLALAGLAASASASGAPSAEPTPLLRVPMYANARPGREPSRGDWIRSEWRKDNHRPLDPAKPDPTVKAYLQSKRIVTRVVMNVDRELSSPVLVHIRYTALARVARRPPPEMVLRRLNDGGGTVGGGRT